MTPGGRLERRETARRLRPVLALAALLGGGLAAGCDMCETGELRCDGHVVQECNSTRNWEDTHDCGADTCGVGREVCHPFIDLGFGEVWCCYH